jgi:hypothetical protein
LKRKTEVKISRIAPIIITVYGSEPPATNNKIAAIIQTIAEIRAANPEIGLSVFSIKII